MAEIRPRDDGTGLFTIAPPLRGIWTHASPLSVPDGMTPELTNINIIGNLITSQRGNKKFISTAWGADTINLLCDRRVAGSEPTIIIATTTGAVYKWNSSGPSWDPLRTGLSTTSTLYWTFTQYGTDLFITNPTDGIYRYDGNTLVPIGATPIAQCESDEAALWANETADTTNYREGSQSMYVESSGAAATMTFTPATNINATTGRLSARAYLLTKASGTDFFHFKVMFSNTGTIDTSNTQVVITDGSAKSLTWAYTLWDSDRSGTALANPPVADTWYDVYLKPTDATEVATFAPTDIDTIAFTVDTSAGTLRMNVDDIYVIYSTTMPACQYIEEWKNILFGAYTTANPDSYHWSPVRAPDEYTSTATTPIKAGGDSITALKKFFHQLTIGTDNHVHTLSGSIVGQTYPVYLFDVNEVTDEAGISSHRSVVKAGNKLYWFYHRDIIAYNGTGVEKISYPIDATLDGIHEGALPFIVGARFRDLNEIWWTFRRAGQSTNDRLLKYNYVTGSFLNGLANSLATPMLGTTYESGVERLLSCDNTNRFIYREDDDTPGYQFFGTNIAYVVELPAVGVTDRALEWVEAFITYLSNTGSITVAYRIADHLRALSGTSYTTLETVNQAVAGELGRIRAGYVGKVCQFKITSTAVPFQLQFPFSIRAQDVGSERVFP